MESQWINIFLLARELKKRKWETKLIESLNSWNYWLEFGSDIFFNQFMYCIQMPGATTIQKNISMKLNNIPTKLNERRI